MELACVVGIEHEREDGKFFKLANTGHVMKAVAERDDNGNITSVRITTVSKLAFASRSPNHREPMPIGGGIEIRQEVTLCCAEERFFLSDFAPSSKYLPNNEH